MRTRGRRGVSGPVSENLGFPAYWHNPGGNRGDDVDFLIPNATDL